MKTQRKPTDEPAWASAIAAPDGDDPERSFRRTYEAIGGPASRARSPLPVAWPRHGLAIGAAATALVVALVVGSERRVGMPTGEAPRALPHPPVVQAPAIDVIGTAPARPKVGMHVGDSQDFAVSALGRDLHYGWTIDGAPAGDGPRWTFTPEADQVGTRRIEVTISGDDVDDRRTWRVRVWPGRAPEILMARPATPDAAVTVGKPVRLALDAAPATPADRVTIRWTVDGTPAGEGRSLTFRPDHAGTAEVRAVATGALGGTAERTWSVAVAGPAQPPIEVAKVERETPPPARPEVPPTPAPTPPAHEPESPQPAPSRPATPPPSPPSPSAAVEAPAPPVAKPAPPAEKPAPDTTLARRDSEAPAAAPAPTPMTPPRVVADAAPARPTSQISGDAPAPPPPVTPPLDVRSEPPPPARDVAPAPHADAVASARPDVAERVAREVAPPPVPVAPRVERATPSPAAAEAPRARDPERAPTRYASRPAAPQDEARRLLERYAAAWRARDVDALRELGQVQSDRAAEALRRYFAQVDDFSVEVDLVAVRSDGDRTIVEFTRRDRFRDPTGRMIEKQSPPIEKEVVHTPEGLRFAGGRG